MDNSKYISTQRFKKILDNLFDILKEINHIIIINTNEIFLDNVLDNIKKDPLISDTIKLLKLVESDMSKIAYSNKFFEEIEKNNLNQINNMDNKIDYSQNNFGFINEKENKFCELSKRLEKIMCEICLISNNYSDKVQEIIKNEDLQKKQEKVMKIPKAEKEKKIKIKNKKSYEVDLLSRFMIDIFNENNIKILIELGCGKSYLTKNILIKEDMIYVGIDKKDHLIEKSHLKTKKNIILISEIVDYENFNAIYEEQIKKMIVSINDENILHQNSNIESITTDDIDKINTFENNNKFCNNQFINDGNIDVVRRNNTEISIDKEKIMLFGLHSCGNLTSDSIKIFVRNEVVTHLVIVGCCLNLLMEYVSKEVRGSEAFNYYMSSIGFDNRGNFLENTFSYEWDFRKIGYPLSNYIKKEKKEYFLGRPLRNIAMQNIPRPEDNIINSKKNYKYKNLLFRTLLQKFFEDYLPELKFIYGYGKLELNLDDGFSLYVKNCLKRIEKMIDENDLNVQNLDNTYLKNKVIGLRNSIKTISEVNNQDSRENKILNNEIKNPNVLNEKEDNHNVDLQKFFEKYSEYENILWAFYVIRIKFSKIIEYIIALDRVIFLKENNIENVELVKIFDDNKSARNILIYASK